MSINKLNLSLAILFTSMISVALPVNADNKTNVVAISFKPSVKYNKCVSTSKERTKIQKAVLNSKQSSHCYAPRKVGKYNYPKIGGLQIDACVRGSGWSKSNPKRCDARRLNIIANDFCKSKGYKKPILISKKAQKGKHAVLTFKKGKPSHSFWKREQGHLVVNKIYCQ